MNTNITKTNGTTLASIPPGQYNSTVSSLILFGKNFANYGTYLNENLVHLMENFADQSPPQSPTQGQLWYKTTDKQMYVWDGVAWKLLNAESLQQIADAIVKNRIYVSESGNDSNSGQSWYSAKRTVKAACATAAQQLATGAFRPDHVAILVAAGDYTEDCPLEIPPGVSIIGDNLRSVTIRPRVPTSDVFYLNSKCYVYGITVRDHRLSPSALDITPVGYANASGVNTSALISTTRQTGFAFGFAPGADILVSPYIQNCSSISGDPDTGSGIYPGGGGVLIDPSVLGPNNRIHSIVVDAFTQINLGGIGVKVLGKGYMQLVSFFVNFCQFGLLCIDGGHVTALNSNCSFGNYALWSQGHRYLESTDSPVAVNQIWATNGVSTDFVTTGGTYVLPNQFSDLEVQFLDSATPLLPTVDYTISKGVTTGGLPCSVITLKSLPVAGRQLRARIKFGSLIEASGYTMSYAGAGLDYAKLSPSQDGSGFADPNKYTIALNGGRVFHTTTDESGDFYVGAVAPNPAFQVGGLTIANGGGSYSVGDTLTFSTPANINSTYAVPTTLKVLSTSGGAITSVAIQIPGYYLLSAPNSTTPGSLPTNPITATSTSGGGSAATFNFVWEKPPARPSFRINQRRGAIDGRSFYQSIFGFMTPFILALSRKGP
jgi:hypothetical protein